MRQPGKLHVGTLAHTAEIEHDQPAWHAGPTAVMVPHVPHAAHAAVARIRLFGAICQHYFALAYHKAPMSGPGCEPQNLQTTIEGCSPWFSPCSGMLHIVPHLQVLGVSAGDVVLDLLVNCDPVPILEACMDRGAHYLNAATDVSRCARHVMLLPG